MVKMQAIGHLGKDAILNNVNGKTVINFSVAHTEKFKDAQGQSREKTLWIECAYWTDKTGVAQYLKKGQQVYVDGTPDVRNYTTNDGRNGASLVLRVQSIQLLGSSGGSGNQTNQVNQMTERNYGSMNTPHGQGNPSDLTEPLDDLPF